LSSLPSWTDAKVLSIDVETKDPDIKSLGPGVRRPGNRVVGFGFAIEDGPEFYLPISHEGGDNCEGDVWGYVREQFRNFRGVLTGANLPYDGDWCMENGVDFSGVKSWEDVQVTDPLINELHDRYDLETLCQRYELPGKDESVLREAAAVYRSGS
jgi:hypothetical protein